MTGGSVSEYVRRYNRRMKLPAFCLLFALTLSAQVVTGDSIVSRLESALQTIDADQVHTPISIVIAVQTNYEIQAAMVRSIPKIRSMLEPLVSSLRGEVEVLSYGDRVRVFVVQPFTSDSSKAAEAIAHPKILSALQGSTSNVLDAIAQATSDLETRPSSRRQIVLVLGKNTNDPESEKKLKDFIGHAADRLPNLVFLFPLVP
ncbi:MAG: VWA domain-containing protein [Bryobacteraceae bacterium]